VAQQFIAPRIEEVANMGLLRADSEQQQQQQQQQQSRVDIRRYLNVDTMLPEEEIVTNLTTQIKTVNKLVPRSK
jgi:hypothetical protein